MRDCKGSTSDNLRGTGSRSIQDVVKVVDRTLIGVSHSAVSTLLIQEQQVCLDWVEVNANCLLLLFYKEQVCLLLMNLNCLLPMFFSSKSSKFAFTCSTQNQ